MHANCSTYFFGQIREPNICEIVTKQDVAPQIVFNGSQHREIIKIKTH